MGDGGGKMGGLFGMFPGMLFGKDKGGAGGESPMPPAPGGTPGGAPGAPMPGMPSQVQRPGYAGRPLQRFGNMTDEELAAYGAANGIRKPQPGGA